MASTVTQASMTIKVEGLVNDYFQVRSTPNKGYGCFALKPITRGTRVLEEPPLLFVPIGNYLKADIKAVYDTLTPDEQALYFSLHSNHGQDPKQWPSRIHESVSAQERKRIEQQHNARIAAEPSLISVFQTNCMEMRKGAAVFPHAARINHSCNPNAVFSWNEGIGKETIHIAHDVQAGEEITISYCDMMHDKALRSYELKHYGFVCKCKACLDDDDASSFTSQSAARRYRLQELERETHFFRYKNLEQGLQQKDFLKKLLEMAALHKAEGEYSGRLAGLLMDIARIHEHKGDLKMALLTAKKARQVMKDCAGEDFPAFSRFAGVVQNIESKLRMQGSA